MRYPSRFTLITAILCLCIQTTAAEDSSTSSVPVRLGADRGVSLKLYVLNRVRFREGEAVHAKLIEPIWSFDQIVIPAGSTVEGRVVALTAVPNVVRWSAILGGDFTPLKRAEVSFSDITFPDGKKLAVETDSSLGLTTIYDPPRPAKKAKPPQHSTGRVKSVEQFGKQQIQTQIRNQANARSYGLYDFVRGPNKREWLENFLLSKLPYHPQWYRSRTRFNATLTNPLDFGTVRVSSAELAAPGAPVPPDANAQMTLAQTVSSSDAHVGDRIEGYLSEPFFTPEHKLLFPQGTRFSGRITLAQHAKLLHRGGKLRFAIEDVAAPQNQLLASMEPVALPKTQPVRAQLLATEAGPTQVNVDPEGTATAKESKTRLLRPVVAALVAAKSMDNDAGKQTASGGAASPNYGGLALGGFSGFGSLGTAVAAGPRELGVAFGYYGLAWSIYSNVIARGREVTFEKNSSVAIKFGQQRGK